ncbi:MAG TPA: hypothetical protein VGK24_15325 [Candidatus Angelobacter sp.]|jgi:hypothetical protein
MATLLAVSISAFAENGNDNRNQTANDAGKQNEQESSEEQQIEKWERMSKAT